MSSTPHAPAPQPSQLRRFWNCVKEGDGGELAFAWLTAVGFTVLVLSGTYEVFGLMKVAAVPMASNVIASGLPHDEHGRTNVLLLGVGGKNHPGGDLTDSIIIASVHPDTQSVSLMSLPRDLYVIDTTVTPESRINAQYVHYRNLYEGRGQTKSGASILALKTLAVDIGKRLDLPMHGVVKIDFTAFTEIVDTLGGIDIDVPEALVDYSYPIKQGTTGTFSVDAGPQHFDGEAALRYARSRVSTSDFDRSARQQLILSAAVEKIQAQGLVSNMRLVDPILHTIRDNAEWTFSEPELVMLAGALMLVPRQNIVHMSLNASVGGTTTLAERGGFIVRGSQHIASGAILVPYSLTGKADDWSQLRSVATMVFSHRDVYHERPTITIAAMEGEYAQARMLQNELLRYGFVVETKITKQEEIPVGRILVGANAWTLGEFLSEILDFPTESTDAPSRILLRLPDTYKFEPFSDVIVSSSNDD